MGRVRTHELAANIKAVNRANAAAMDYQRLLLAYFSQFVGQKVLKADGSFTKKVQDDLPKLPEEYRARTWREGSNYSLSWGVDCTEEATSESGRHTSTTYGKSSFQVGLLDGDVLASLANPAVMRTNWTVEEVEEARKRADEAERAHRDAVADCGPFGA